MNEEKETIASQIHNFFEEPRGFWAIAVQILIFALIFLSITLIIVEYIHPEIYIEYMTFFDISEYIILIVFTIEYCLRLVTAPKKRKWMFKPLNIVDFLAIFPNYIEIILEPILDQVFPKTTVIRALRLLRIIRLLRIFKLAKYKSLFSYRKTIFQRITPFIVFFIALKIGVMILERENLWIKPDEKNLFTLFTIIGFALGIILSQKIGVTYNKFIQVDETVVKLYGTLRSLKNILDKKEPNLGSKICLKWAKCFLHLIRDKDADNVEIFEVNDELYDAISKIEPVPSELAILHVGITQDAAYCLSKKIRLTPKAYDTLLHQASIFYFLLIVFLLPGLVGLFSVAIVTYVLYGMYNLTKDLDSILGGDYDLIDIDTTELKRLVGILGKELGEVESCIEHEQAEISSETSESNHNSKPD